MSWAAEDWTSGLSSLVQKKVQELQIHNEKLIRERQQRQLQLDNSEAALHKQKQKVSLHDSLLFICSIIVPIFHITALAGLTLSITLLFCKIPNS